jgi:hypothetical protein
MVIGKEQFPLRAQFQTRDDGHFRLKHVVKDILSDFN